MTQVFGAHIFSDRDPNQNLVQMNSLLMNLVSQAAFCDCQSMPLRTHFADFYSKARFSVENSFDKYFSSAPIELRPTKTFERYMEQRPYTDVMSLRAEIPEGLSVTFMEYLNVLRPAQQRANAVLADVVIPFSDFVGKLISDPAYRDQPGHQIKEFKKLEPEYVKTIKAFADCFGKNSYKASAAFSEVVRRNADWKTVFSQTEELKRLYQAFPGKEITTKLNRLYEMLDVLIEQVKKNEFDRVTKEVTEVLSIGMYHVAKEIELASLTTFRSKTFITAINTTIKNIEAMPAVK